MDKVEEILPRIASFLRDDLSKEALSSKAEKKRLYYVSRIEQTMQDSAAQEIIMKYEPLSGGVGVGGGGVDVERRSVLRGGNVVPTPFNRISFPSSTETKAPEQKPNQITVAYEVLPCDQTYEEVCTKDVYEEARVHGTALSKSFSSISTSSISYVSTNSSSSSSNGTRPPVVHPPHPPPLPPVRSASPPPPVYEEAFQSITERIQEASDSESDTDYEEYAEAEEKEEEDEAKEKYSQPIRKNSSKLLSKGRQQNAPADLTGKRHSGYLHQKGTFQFQRRFCALCGTRFLCCKSERSLKVVLEINVREYEVVHQERREGKTSAYPHEVRFSCPGKETYLFYTESRQSAEDWVRELRRAAAMKQDSVDASGDSVDSASLVDETDRQSENGENISGGSIEKVKGQSQNAPDDVRKKSKLQSLLGTVGKKLGNKTKNFFQGGDNANQKPIETELKFGYVNIRSEEFTGDRWFRRFCVISDGHLNCYTDHESLDVRPEFSLDLRGAQLKSDEKNQNELLIRLVKDGKEHCLKIFDTMHHGEWLGKLITVTGFASQLAAKSAVGKEIIVVPSIYEELPSQLALSGVTEDDTNIDDDDDDEPPPLPTASPPASPMPDVSGRNHRGLTSTDVVQSKKNPHDPEGIYLQPSDWLHDVEELKLRKRRQPLNVIPCPVEEESTYINRDFARKALNSRERTPKKEGHPEKHSMNSSSSYPNLTSLGISHNGSSGEGASGKDAPRGAAGAGGADTVDGGKAGKFRPSSALVESLENLADLTDGGRKNCRGKGVTKGSSHSFDRSVGIIGQPMTKKKDERISDLGFQKKPQDPINSKILWDEYLKNSRRRTSGSDSSDDPNNKKMVLNLVQMFERKA